MAQLPVTGAAAGLQLGEESSCSRTSDRSSSASSSDMSEVKLLFWIFVKNKDFTKM
jgi:hypothetical protein